MSQYIQSDDVAFITFGWWEIDPEVADLLVLMFGGGFAYVAKE